MACIQEAFFIGQPIEGCAEVIVRADRSNNCDGVTIGFVQKGEAHQALWMPLDVAEKLIECLEKIVESEK